MDEQETEQQTEPTEPEQPGEATRDELIALAREASEQAEPAAAATAAAPATDGDPPPAPNPEEKIASILKAREASRAKRLDADEYATGIRRQAEAERDRIIAEARAEARRTVEEEVAGRRKRFAASPTAALRELADDPQDIIDAVLREGTPEARVMAQLQKDLAETKQQASIATDVKKQIDDMRREAAEQSQAAEIDRVRAVFLGQHATTERAPHLHARFDPDEIFERANRIAVDWRQQGAELGKDFDFDDVVTHLELDSKKRFEARLKSSAQPSGAGAPERGSGLAPKSAANGTRTITVASSSERRASPKPFSDLSAAEQREDLIRVAQEAYRQHGKS